ISPMALLLNATLMSHVSAMFMAAVFVYAYWRVTRNGRRRFAWAIAAGLALGWIISTRPLTAVAIAAPVALHAVSRVLDTVFEKNLRSKLWATLAPLIVLAVFVLPTGALWPENGQHDQRGQRRPQFAAQVLLEYGVKHTGHGVQ